MRRRACRSTVETGSYFGALLGRWTTSTDAKFAVGEGAAGLYHEPDERSRSPMHEVAKQFGDMSIKMVQPVLVESAQ
jgi:hypothetical protein